MVGKGLNQRLVERLLSSAVGDFLVGPTGYIRFVENGAVSTAVLGRVCLYSTGLTRDGARFMLDRMHDTLIDYPTEATALRRMAKPPLIKPPTKPW